MWVFRCDCGNEKTIRACNVKAKVNPTTSCGCALGYEDLTGRRFGRWEVMARRGNDNYRNARWLCRCDCGIQSLVSSDALRSGQSKSCGCIVKTQMGDSGSPEYAAWGAMIRRCHNPSDPHFVNYGARGICVCDEWRGSYAAFLAHVGRRPSELHSIDRVNNDGNYEPGNMRWATRSQQNSNTRRNKRAR